VRAASWAQSGMVIGLGTGRAAAGFVRELGERVRNGLEVRGIPTSRVTESLARSLGIPLIGFGEVAAVDLAVDGADEVDPNLNLIKGHGGALVRERVVAAAASRFVVLVGPEKLSHRLGARRSVIGFEEVAALDLAVDGADEVDPDLNLIKGHGGALVRERVVAAAASRFLVLVGPEKLSRRLGAKRSVPVEAIPFAAPQVRRALERMGAEAEIRIESDGKPFVTDNRNLLVNASFGEIADPAALHRQILEIPGVLDSGLFAGMADEVLVEGQQAPSPAGSTAS